MPKTQHLILGAGIAGCALARHLSEREAVLVVDPRPIGGGASGRAAGIVTEQLWNSWDIAVTREAHEEARKLLAGREPRAYWRTGFLRFTQRSDRAEVLRASADRLRAEGVEVRWLEGAALRDRVDGLRLGPGAVGLESPHDGCVSPAALTEAYFREALARGALFRTGLAVGAFRPNDGGWLLEVGGEEWTAPSLVLAAGAWSKRLLASLHHPLPICPYRTQAALLRPERAPSEDLPGLHDVDTDVYGRPELSGRVLVGDGTEPFECDPDRAVPGGDPAFLAHLAEALAGPLPDWSGAEVVSAWAGVCSATPDRRPLIGPVPGAPGLSVMTGFNGFGIMRAGGAARRLADRLLRPDDASTERALAPVDPSRFTDPEAPFGPKPGFTVEGGDAPRC